MPMKENGKIAQRAMHWYVMLHLEPEMIEHYLQQENEQRRQKNLRLLEYFIPFQFLPKAVPDQYAKDVRQQRSEAADVNDLRRTLHNFVFVKATDREMTRLVNRPWNREGRLRMSFYYTHDGRRITMPAAMMEKFINLCLKGRQRFSFGPAIDNIDDFDTVVIARGTFCDTEAKVLDVQHTAEGISLTLGIPFFSGEKMLTLPGYRLCDLHLPRMVETLLNDHFVDNVEAQLAGILDRRIRRESAAEQEKADVATLNHLFHYSYVRLHDVASQCRFRALMLICAALRADSESRDAMTEEAVSLLGGRTEAAGEHDAYLMAALYVATANADYRTAAKHFLQQHADTAHSLGSIMKPVKRMNKKFFKSIQVKTK